MLLDSFATQFAKQRVGFHASGVWLEIFYCTLLVPGFSFLHINDSTAIERYTLVL